MSEKNGAVQVVAEEDMVRVEHADGAVFVHPDSSKLGWLLETIMDRSPNIGKVKLGKLTADREIWGKKPDRELIGRAKEKSNNSTKDEDVEAS
ncbi:MAG: hypothetical protein CMN76_13210 [Spirochaetaceae bacterium]|nr:hypothetical protein [Spirochaetaceae bacterium]MBU43032.1 hypothetical protein [Spirochaetaceae bacterium]MBU44175.1 hypothetical protein [Spirochaetaceae bacterium]